ncbi:LURP-one-related/scramblase family protein [Microbacterium sp. NPDC058062]|uniref:LURP-one-related/scramblase family protein n=1 Tax=Microbacterium sp. NPDC058062 TaxID=3346320 RepID=UPI0036DA295C
MAPLGRRDDRQERREERRGGASDNEVFQMREKLVSVGDDYWIETIGGRRAFKVDGKVARIRDTLVIRDVAGNEVAKVQERKIAIRDTMAIERPGRPDATIKKALINPLRDRFTLSADDAGEIDIQGNIVDHEYDFERDGAKIAEVSKRWLRVRDSYGVEIVPGEDIALILAATVALDQLSH